MTEPRGSDYVLSRAHQAGVGFVELWVTDIAGRLRGATVTLEQLEAAMSDGFGVDAQVLGAEDDAGSGEVVLMPDPATWAVLPWEAEGGPLARIICDAIREDGAPSPFDARTTLKQVVASAVRHGTRFYVGAEIEHYYYVRRGEGASPTPLARSVPYGFAPEPDGAGLARSAAAAFAKLGGVVSAILSSAGPGQHRMALAWSDALTLADGLVTQRRVVRELARRAGAGATFMAHPFQDVPGSALALTISMADGAEPGFADPQLPDGLSPLARQFAAGIVQRPELSLVARPTVNSYTRPLAGAVTRPAARNDERGAAVAYLGADAGANPYLLLATVLDAGLAGIDAVAVPAEAAATRQPLTLAEAALMARESRQLEATLGRPLRDALITAAEADGAAYRSQVTAWEQARYLDDQ